MSKVSPVTASHPVRPGYSPVGVDHGRAGSQDDVCGMGENSRAVFGADAVEEVVEAEEESQPVDTLPTPNMPTQSERDDHDLTHYPYRSWCKHCVEGRGVDMGHRMGGDHSSRGVAIISFDYIFVTDGSVHSRDEWEKSDEREVDGKTMLKVLVVRDMRSKAVFAHAVETKGDDEAGFAVRCVVDDVAYLGYSRVILKSDNEPAIVHLLREALKRLRVEGLDQVGEEHPLHTTRKLMVLLKLELN